MSVTAVEKIWESGGNFSVANDGTASGSINVTYNVFVDDPENDNELVVIAAAGLPKREDQHPNSFYYRVTSVVPKRVSPIQYIASVTYSSIGGSTNDENPLNQPAVIKWRTYKEVGEIDEDVNGKSIVNQNGEPMRGIKRPFSNLAAVITKNFATFDRAAFQDVIDHIDTGGILGSAPGTAVCDEITADPVTQGTFNYYAITAVVLFRKPIRTTAQRTWWYRTLAEGFKVKDDNGDIVNATDERGENVSSTVRLKADGTEETDPSANGHYLEFEVLPTTNLAAAIVTT